MPVLQTGTKGCPPGGPPQKTWVVIAWKNDNDQKAAILWNSFKDRIGTAGVSHMHFNIEHLSRSVNQEELEQPFTKEEVDDIIKTMPNAKSLGPDGLNGIYMKKCYQGPFLQAIP